MAHLRNCVLCGTAYEYCPRCDETEPAYKLKYCGQNCNDISSILNKYAFKHLTKEEAAMELLKLNVELDKYNDHNKNYIKDILEAVKKPDPMPEAEPMVEEEKPVEKKVTYKRPLKRNKIVNDN